MTTSGKQHWETQVDNWIEWARTPGFDAYWYYRDRFLAVIPPPTGPTVDVGCGEGRLTRDLAERGYDVTGVEPTPGLLKAAQEAEPYGNYLAGEAGSLPLQADSVELLVSYNMLMDVDDIDEALREFHRVLSPSGRLAISIVHPVSDSVGFDRTDPDAPFVIEGSYLRTQPFDAVTTREGRSMHFSGWHRSLTTYVTAMQRAGFLIETIREPMPVDDAPPEKWDRWRRMPMFMHILALKR